MSADFLCPDCGSPLDETEHPLCPECGWHPAVRKPTRQEQLEGLADRGVDTLEEYREER